MNRGIWEELEENRAVYRLLTAGAAREATPAGADEWEQRLNPRAGDYALPLPRPVQGDRREPLWGEGGTGKAEPPPEQAPAAKWDQREEKLPAREAVYSLGRVPPAPVSALAAGAEDSHRGSGGAGEAEPQPAGPKEDPVDALLERLERESRLRPQVAEE